MSELKTAIQQPPLYIDLDNTLSKTNTLHEATLGLLRTKPWYLFWLPFWLLRGQAYLWQRLSEHVSLNVALLPYRPEVLAFLKQEYEAGRELVLISGSHHTVVSNVAQHLALFHDALGSTESVHLVSERKLAAITEHAQQQPFDYIGDSRHDLPIWQASRKAIVVSGSNSLWQQAQKLAPATERIKPIQPPYLKAIFKAMRPHQWAKNLLLFAAVFLSHQFTQLPLVLNSALGFLAFSLCGSAVYVINDLADLEADRLHTKKRKRPFAAGDVSALTGAMLAVLLLAGATTVTLVLPKDFAFVLAGYFVLTLLYSVYLKEKLLIDVFLLGGLFTIRVWAGGACTGIAISHWALAFFMCLFLSLALAKRYSELASTVAERGEGALHRRNYRTSDMQFLLSLGCSSALISMLVVTLYINSADVVRYYRRPSLLWLICPLLGYWSSRLWLIAARGRLDEDPVLFTIKDKVSYLTGSIIALIVLLAI